MGEEATIRRLVKEIDPRFDCRWESDSEEYVITQTSPLGSVSWFDSVRYDRLTRAFFDHMREIVYINRNGDITERVAKLNQKKAERDKNASDDLAYGMADELLLPLLKN